MASGVGPTVFATTLVTGNTKRYLFQEDENVRYFWLSENLLVVQPYKYPHDNKKSIIMHGK